jgi:hypothetical protein
MKHEGKQFVQTSYRGNEGREPSESTKSSHFFHTSSLYKLSGSSLVKFVCVAQSRGLAHYCSCE